MGQSLSNFSQFFPPKPTFTEANILDLKDKVYLVTGANTGVGKDVARILYSKNAKVWIAARSEEKTNKAIEEIKKSSPDSKGSLSFHHLDLADLNSVKKSAEQFIASESKLHVLFSNAGVQSPDADGKTAQGHEIHVGVNCLGTFLFTKLLTPLLANTAKAADPGTVRVVWVSSFVDLVADKRTGLPLDKMDFLKIGSPLDRYAYSKVGNYLHAVEYARRHKEDGIICVPLNPGNLASDLYRDQAGIFKFFVGLIVHPVINGAYTELFAGLTPKISLQNTGAWVIPFARLSAIRKDLEDVLKTEEQGGTDAARKWWTWSEEQVKPYE
ncbi:unnamed protein product [Clonostachys rhizophaga]|uniref:Uncharacterized protein n=1 Tax=Clonostachys rhizophaga TaxID=160324 RepID=A0A9N9YT77_9HYPO|nr:unnamed protein product [Clonostachys rhizophaga]